MSSQVHQDPTVPRGALLAAGGMVVLTLLAVASVRLGFVSPAGDPAAVRVAENARPVASRDLVFLDGADGSVEVRDAATGTVRVAVAANSKIGFIRGVMRGLARARHLRGLDKAAPFRLTRWSNGNLTLLDPGTGQSVELGSFGPTNRAAFEALL